MRPVKGIRSAHSGGSVVTHTLGPGPCPCANAQPNQKERVCVRERALGETDLVQVEALVKQTKRQQ